MSSIKHTLYQAHAWIITRGGGPEHADRGESPVSTAVIVAGLAVFAVAVVAVVTGVGQRFLDQIDAINP